MPKHMIGPDCPSCTEKLKLADPFFTPWFSDLRNSFPEVHISWTFRDEAEQNAAVADGKSKLAWPDSPHNKQPALACDLFEISSAYPNGKWNGLQMARIDAWNQEKGYDLVWGGHFRELGDADHFEVKK